MKTGIALLMVLIFALSGCAGSPQGVVQEPSGHPISMEPSSGSTTQTSTPEKEPEAPVLEPPLPPQVEEALTPPRPHHHSPSPLLPEQVKKLIARSMKKCELLYFSPQGKELQSVSVGHGNYAGAQLSPGGNVLLFELDPTYYMGVNCDYILYNIPENRLIYFNGRLWGNQLILDDNLICNAVGGWLREDYRFYDMEYQELGLCLDINRGANLERYNYQYPEIEITGLGYDRRQSQYYLTMSRDKTQGMGNQVVEHSVNELLIGVYDQNGACIKTIPTGYRAPYFNNIQGVYRNFPAVLPDGKLLVQAHTQAGEYGERITLLIDPEQETISPWKMNMLASGENNLVLMAQDHDGTHELILMDWASRKVHHQRSRYIFDGKGREYWVKGAAFGKLGGYYIAQRDEEYQALFYFSYQDFSALHLAVTYPAHTANFVGLDETDNAIVFNGFLMEQ